MKNKKKEIGSISLILLIVFTSLTYFIFVDFVETILLFLFSCTLLFYFQKNNKTALKLLIVVLLSNSILLFGNLIFAPNTPNSISWGIFNVNSVGLKTGTINWLVRSSVLLLGYSWIISYSISEVSEIIINISFSQKAFQRKKWIIAFFNIFQKERNQFIDFYKSLKNRKIYFSINIRKNVFVLLTITKKYLDDFFVKSEKYNYSIETHYLDQKEFEYQYNLKIQNLFIKYAPNQKPVLSNINLDIQKGEFVLVLGKDKSGKSTLLKCFSGYIPHITGFINGDINALENTPLSTIGKHIVYLPENVEDYIFGTNTSQELESSNLFFKDKIKELGLTDFNNILEKEFSKLSGGEKVKLAILSILIREPEILIVDSPFSQLDVESRTLVIDILSKINQFHKTTIIVAESSIIEEVKNVASRVILIEDGKIILNDYIKNLETPLNIILNKANINIPLIDIIAKKTDESILNISNLNVTFDKNILLKDIFLTLNKGELIALTGKNGCGKTTLALTICGIENSLWGNIKKKGNIEIIGNISYVFQNPFSQTLSSKVEDELEFDLKYRAIKNYKIISNELLEIINLNAVDNIENLSYNEIKRLNFASVLHMSDIIILDEPTINTDFEGKNQIIKLVNYSLSLGKSIIIITHDQHLLEKINTIYLLNNGFLKCIKQMN